MPAVQSSPANEMNRTVFPDESPAGPSAAIEESRRQVSSSTVSVAMCTFNGERFLSEQLQSVLNQTRLPDQMVICDDASTDSTQTLLTAFADNAPFPVVLRFNPCTLGVTRNFEQALAACHGDFIALSDQDDRWSPSKLQRLESLLIAHPTAGFACSNAMLIDDRGRRLKGRLWDHWRIDPSMLADEAPDPRHIRLLRANCVTGATMMIRGDLVRQFALPISANWIHDHWITVLCEFLGRPGCVSTELLTEYRRHERQVLGLRQRRRSQRLDERERLKSLNLKRYRDLQEHIEKVFEKDARSTRWQLLIQQATDELLQHSENLERPWWQREWHRLLKRRDA